MKKKMSLKVEDLEERIAPSIATPGLPMGEGGAPGTTTVLLNGVAGPASGAALWGVFTDSGDDPDFGDPGGSDLSNVNPGNGNIEHFLPS